MCSTDASSAVEMLRDIGDGMMEKLAEKMQMRGTLYLFPAPDSILFQVLVSLGVFKHRRRRQAPRPDQTLLHRELLPSLKVSPHPFQPAIKNAGGSRKTNNSKRQAALHKA